MTEGRNIIPSPEEKTPSSVDPWATPTRNIVNIDPPEPKGGLARATLIVTLVLGLLGHGATITAAVIGQSGKDTPAAISCPTEIGKAIELHKANPTLKIQYSGELEAQCHVNDIISQLP